MNTKKVVLPHETSTSIASKLRGKSLGWGDGLEFNIEFSGQVEHVPCTDSNMRSVGDTAHFDIGVSTDAVHGKPAQRRWRVTVTCIEDSTVDDG